MRFLRQPWMIWYAISLHFLYGFLLIADERQYVLALLGGFQHLLELFGTYPTGALLIAVATLASLGLIFDRKIPRKWSLASLMPQYAVLLLALFSTLEICIGGFTTAPRQTESGAYVPGVEVPLSTILFAIGPIGLAAFWHSLAIISLIVDPLPPVRELETIRDRLTLLELEKRQRQRGKRK